MLIMTKMIMKISIVEWHYSWSSIGMLVLLEKTFAIVILSVAIAKSKNLRFCLLSKINVNHYLCKQEFEISRLRSRWQKHYCSEWQGKSAVYSNTMQKYSAFNILKITEKIKIKISRKCYVFGCYFLCKV